MMKTISAALLAASMIAAPALAAGSGSKAAQNPADKTMQAKVPVNKTPQTPANAKTTATKSNKLNANASMVRHHRHHKHHKKISSRRFHASVLLLKY